MGCRELQVNDYFRMTDSASGTDVAYYALADANKNITDYFDTNGNVVAHYEYSPFGKIAQQSGTMASDFDYRFSSEVFDDETGLVYYNYRYYSAELGRWLRRDPSLELAFQMVQEQEKTEDFETLYGMVSNNSVNNRDKLGLQIIVGHCPRTLPWRKILKGAGAIALLRIAGCLAAINELLIVCNCVSSDEFVRTKCFCDLLERSTATRWLCKIAFLGYNVTDKVSEYIGCDSI